LDAHVTARWTVDQWMPAESGANRMGGFFHAYVVFHVALLVGLVVRERLGKRGEGGNACVASRAALGFLAFTGVVAWLPQSHELRYYMAWMIVLVATNLWLACRPGIAGARAPLRLPRMCGLSAMAALTVVCAVTHGAYVKPGGTTFAELVADKVDARVVKRIPEGARVCVEKEPWTMLWSARFHADAARYLVKEAEEPADCEGYTPLARFATAE
jgi:hypothetical protein